MKLILKYGDYIKRQLLFTIKFIKAYLSLLFITDNTFDDIWLISERGDEARDNGYHLFKYIRKKHPNINVYYLITENSHDFSKVKKYGNIIEYGTLKHYQAFIKANYLISTHHYGYAQYGKACVPFLKILSEKNIIHLRHGVAYNKHKIENSALNLLICSSELEKKIIEENNERKLPIKITGLCRYDGLIDKSKLEEEKIILLMPTFRSWLHDLSRIPNSNKLFIEEEYYKFYNDILNNKSILELCKRNNAKIYFYPHYRIQNYLNTFEINNEFVVIANKEDFDIQDLLNKSSILLTDYSSIFFDFAYMKKPILYTQFDKERFYSEHYEASSFSFEKNAFGKITESVEDIERELYKIINNDFKMEEKYIRRVNDFFKYNDTDNCKRNFEEILKI